MLHLSPHAATASGIDWAVTRSNERDVRFQRFQGTLRCGASASASHAKPRNARDVLDASREDWALLVCREPRLTANTGGGWMVRVQIHQPLGGARGQATDIELQAHEMMYHKNTLNQFLAEFCGKTMAEMKADTDRDFFLGAYEAVEYGVVDEVLSNPHWDEVSKVNMGMYDFAEYDWRELPTLDPMNEANIAENQRDQEEQKKKREAKGQKW